MATSLFMSQSPMHGQAQQAQGLPQPFRSPGASASVSAAPSAFPLDVSCINSSRPYDRDISTRPVGTPYATTPMPVTHALIRRLPMDMTDEKLRLMVVFSEELVDAELLSADVSEDAGFRAALLKFKTSGGAQQAKDMLNGKTALSSDVEMLVEILPGSPTIRRYTVDNAAGSSNIPSATSSASSSGPSSRQPSRFKGAFQGLEPLSPPMFGGSSTERELPNPDSGTHYQSLFSPQSPIGNHLTERSRSSGKTLISHDGAEDDETRELLKDPVAYAEHGATQHRRATAPQLPIGRMANLSLNTTAASAPVPQYGHPTMTPISGHGHGNALSATAINGSSHSLNYKMANQHFPRHTFPPVNPADQNPPCNTLYVGNLPIDTSEEELKAMFSKQRGYKRLCFRTKQNGPMCFVEFEDVSFATKALTELYGQPLHNSVKGGIRLSFSKNPLGVRSGQSAGHTGPAPMAGLNNVLQGAASRFTAANGPPPGLTAPPGLNRLNYNGLATMSSGLGSPLYASAPYTAMSNSPWNPWNNGMYHVPLSAGGSPMAMSHQSAAFPAPYMMGR